MDGNISNSENALLPQDVRMKILSTSSFPQFFGKKTPKGKGVMHGNVEDKTQHDNGGTCQSDGKSSSFVGMAPGVQLKLLQHRSVAELNPNCDGINLREWLKLGNFIKYKVERLQVFCQIAELVSLAHSQGIVQQHLRPSFFILTPSNQIKYTGLSSDVPVPMAREKKRPPEEDIKALCNFNVKQPKLITDVKFQNPSPTTSIGESRTPTLQDTNHDIGCSYSSDNTENRVLSMSSCQTTVLEKSLVANLQLEEKWYACPECLDGNCYQSFIEEKWYACPVCLEVLYSSDSLEVHSAAMFDMHRRILPPFILSESPKEAGFCMWLLHPDPSSRPTIREILLSELFQGFRESQLTVDSTATLLNDDEKGELEILLDFLVSSKEKEDGHAVKLIQDIRCIEADIKGLEAKTSSSPSQAHAKRDSSLQGFIKTVSRSGRNEARLITEMSQLEKAYFSVRSQTTATTADGRSDKDLLKN